MRMNRFCFLWIIGMLMGAIGMVSCSDDDDEIEYVYESSPTILDGSWHLISASYGIQGVQDYKAGEITLTFDDANKTLKVENRKKISFLDSGTYRYRTTTEKKRVHTYDEEEVEYSVIFIEVPGENEVKYTYDFRYGMLVLDGGLASDGPGYYLKKILHEGID